MAGMVMNYLSNMGVDASSLFFWFDWALGTKDGDVTSYNSHVWIACNDLSTTPLYTVDMGESPKNHLIYFRFIKYQNSANCTTNT